MSAKIKSDFLKNTTVRVDYLEIDEDTTFDNGHHGTVIEFCLYNQTSGPMKVDFIDRTLITVGGEEISANMWYASQNLGKDDTIMAGHFRKGGTIVYHDEDDEVFKPGAELRLKFRDATNSIEYDLYFRISTLHLRIQGGYTSTWTIDKTKSTVKPYDANDDDDPNYREDRERSQCLKDTLECIDVFESQLGVKLDNISVRYRIDEYDKITIMGEILEIDAEKEHKYFTINATFYDENNEIVDLDELRISGFGGYETFKMTAVPKEDIAKRIDHIRLYVRK